MSSHYFVWMFARHPQASNQPEASRKNARLHLARALAQKISKALAVVEWRDIPLFEERGGVAGRSSTRTLATDHVSE